MHPRATPPAPTHPLPTQATHGNPSSVNSHSFTGPPRDGELLGMPRMWKPIHPDWAQQHSGSPATALPNPTTAPGAVAATFLPSAATGGAPTDATMRAPPAVPSAAAAESPAGLQSTQRESHRLAATANHAVPAPMLETTASPAALPDLHVSSAAAVALSKSALDAAEPAGTAHSLDVPTAGNGLSLDPQLILKQQHHQQQHPASEQPPSSIPRDLISSLAANAQMEPQLLSNSNLPGFEGMRPSPIFGIDSSDSEGPMPEIDSGSDGGMADSSEDDQG